MNNVLNNEFERKKVLRTYLANCGWQEIITYSLISEEMKEDFTEKSKENSFYQLLMPKNEYHKYYRQTLIPSHLKALKHNLSHGNKDLFFFEISSVYSSVQQEELLALSGVGKFFNQPLHQLVQELDFYRLKGTLENIFALWQINSLVNFVPASSDYLYSPQSSEIFLGKEKIGFLGRIQSSIAHKYQIIESVFVIQISLTKIFAYLRNSLPQFRYQPVSNFPTSTKDLSFLFPEAINYNEVIKEMKKIGSDNLQEISIFDIYQNVEMEQTGKKSVSFHLIFQNPTRTLENKEVEKLLENIVEKVEKLFMAKLRN